MSDGEKDADLGLTFRFGRRTHLVLWSSCLRSGPLGADPRIGSAFAKQNLIQGLETVLESDLAWPCCVTMIGMGRIRICCWLSMSEEDKNQPSRVDDGGKDADLGKSFWFGR